jgi:hypothetical protein
MQSTKSKYWLTFLLFAALAVNAFGQKGHSNSAPKSGIPGTFDPKTSVFTPSRAVLASNYDVAASTIFGGKLVFNFTITVSSTLPATDKISCGAAATVVDNGGLGNFIVELATSAATRTGSTATCTTTIPYSWPLATASTDMMSLTYTLTAGGTTVTTVLPNRTSEQGLGRLAIPANGATSTFTVAATI